MTPIESRTFLFHVEPLTMNMAYPTNKNGRRYLSKQGKEFKDYIEQVTWLSKKGLMINPDIHFTRLSIRFFSPKFFTAKKTISKNKPDTSNCIKLLEDGIFSALGLNDYISLDFGHVTFRYAERARIEVTLEVFDQALLTM